MTYTPDFSAISEAMTETWTLGTEWLIPVALALLVMAVITRDTEKWKILALPLFVLERILGIPVHFVIMSIAGIFFTLEVLSTQVVGNLIGTTKRWVSRDQLDLRDERLGKQEKILGMFKRAKSQEQYLNKYARKGKKGVDLAKMKELIELRRRMGLQ